jgi:hypothetical protein
MNMNKDGKGNIEYVIQHQKNRFEQLKLLLNSNPNIKVIIAGNNNKHNLGTGIAKNSW